MSANIWQCGDCGGLHQSLPHGLCPDRDRQPNTLKETALGTAKHIATLIRGRGET